jgi:hypothetical protein
MRTANSQTRPAVSVRFGLLFTALSLAFEIAMLAVLRLNIPQDNAVIVPGVLVLAPLATALLMGYRDRTVVKLVATTAAFTLVASVAIGNVTGILGPLTLRPAAGFLSAWVSTDRAPDAPG